MRRRAHSFLLCLLVFGSSSFGCNLENAGDDPPEGLIYMPSALRLSAADGDSPARFLFLVNSNFDLRYNAGSLQAYDLDALDSAIADCDEPGAASCEIDPSDVLVDEVFVPSLATYVAASSDGTRLYVATRTETNLAFVDVDDSDRPLSCGDRGRRHCDAAHTRARDPIASERKLSVPREAVGIVAGDAADLGDIGEGEFVMVAHRAGEISLFLDDRSRSGLQLQDVLTLGGSETPLREPTGIAFDPETKLAYVSIYARDSLEIVGKKVLGRVGVVGGGESGRPASLYDAGPLALEGVSIGRDTRGVTMNPAMPGHALVVARDPFSLLWVDVAAPLSGESAPAQAVVSRTVTVGSGPSRVITGQLGERTVAIVNAFDARQIFVIDAETAEPLSIVHNFSGPFELALDSARQRLYVADFRSSVVRVLDLSALVNGANEATATARIVATLGHPQLVQELQ